MIMIMVIAFLYWELHLAAEFLLGDQIMFGGQTRFTNDVQLCTSATGGISHYMQSPS